MQLKKGITFITATFAFYTFICCTKHVSRANSLSLHLVTQIIYALALMLRNIFPSKKEKALPRFILLSFFIAIIEFIIINIASKLLFENNITVIMFNILIAFLVNTLYQRPAFTTITLAIIVALAFITGLILKLEAVERIQVYIKDVDIEKFYLQEKTFECSILLAVIAMRLFVSNTYNVNYEHKPYFLLAIALVYCVCTLDDFINQLLAIKSNLVYSSLGYLSLIYFVWSCVDEIDFFALVSFSGIFVCILNFLNVFNTLFFKTRFEVIIDDLNYWMLLAYPLVLAIYLEWDKLYVSVLNMDINEQRNRNRGNRNEANNGNGGVVNLDEVPTPGYTIYDPQAD